MTLFEIIEQLRELEKASETERIKARVRGDLQTASYHGGRLDAYKTFADFLEANEKEKRPLSWKHRERRAK